MKQILLTAAAAVSLSASAANIAHTYTFDNGLDDSTGSQPLVGSGGQIVDGRYVFDINEGLTLTNALPNPQDYAIEMRFRLDTLDFSTWKKLIDFQDLQTDDGAYIRNDLLQFYSEDTQGVTPVTAGTDITVIVNRTADGTITMYLDGGQELSVASELGVSATNTLNFFIDDQATSGFEGFPGSVDYIRIFDASLFPSEIRRLLAPNGPQIVVERDLLAPGDGLLTYDASTGREWLDLTATLDRSINDITNNVDGWADLGFVVATDAQVAELWQSLGMRDVGFDTAFNAAGVENHHALLECTFSCSGVNYRRANGLSIFSGANSDITRVSTLDLLLSDDPATGNVRFVGITSNYDYSVFSAGVYAYRDATLPDTDADGIADNADNCSLVLNTDQRDSNGDGFGNACDADLNNDNVVNAADLGLLRGVFFTSDEDADFNGDGVVNFVDLGIMRTSFFAPPGPGASD